MPTYYIDSEVNAASPDGNSWATAYDTFRSLTYPLLAGDIVYVASRHVEPDSVASLTISGPNNSGAGHAKIISVTTGTTTYEKGAYIKAKAAGGAGVTYDLALTDSLAFYGCVFESDDSLSVSNSLDVGQYFYDCKFIAARVADSCVSAINPVLSAEFIHVFENCEFSCGRDTTSTGGVAIFTGDTSSNYTSAFPALLLNCTFTNCSYRTAYFFSGVGNLRLVGCDLSSVPWNCEAAYTLYGSTLRFDGCVLPASWALTGTVASNDDWSCIEVNNSKFGGGETKRLGHMKATVTGTVWDDQIVYLSGGASADDAGGGTQNFSYKMTRLSFHTSPLGALTSPHLMVWVGTTGSKNLDIHIGANEAIDNEEVFAVFEYMGTANSEKLTAHSTYCRLDAPTTYDTAGTWTGSGAPSNGYRIRASVTINEPGWVRAYVISQKPSLTIWVDPRIVVS